MGSEPTGRIDWRVLGNALLGTFVVGLATRVFLVGLPTIAAGLHVNIGSVAWAVLSYQLALFCLSIFFGQLSDIFGSRPIFRLGLVGFVAGSLLCAFAADLPQLVAFRFLQGLGAAMIQSNTRRMALDAMPKGMEGRGQSYVVMSLNTGLLVGPSAGGLILAFLPWRALFFVVAGIGVVGFLLYRRGEPGDDSSKTPRRSIDFLGAAQLAVMMMAVTFLLDRKAVKLVGVDPTGFSAVLGVVGVATLAWFLVHERKAKSPLVSLELFRVPAFTWSIVTLLTVCVVRGLTEFLMPFYLQDVLGYSTTILGVMLLVPAALNIAVSPISGRMIDGAGARRPALIGCVAYVVTVAIGTQLKAGSPWWVPVLLLAMSGVGSGFVTPAAQTLMLGSVPKDRRGFANGLIPTTIQLGLSLGTSLTVFMLVRGGVKDASDPQTFVPAMAVAYGVACALSLVAVAVSSRLRAAARA